VEGERRRGRAAPAEEAEIFLRERSDPERRVEHCEGCR
jgi:hypothetical protein